MISTSRWARILIDIEILFAPKETLPYDPRTRDRPVGEGPA